MPHGGQIHVTHRECDAPGRRSGHYRFRPRARPICGAGGFRQRHRHGSVNAGAHLRALLHDQRDRARHRPWPGDRLRHRAPERRRHYRDERAGPGRELSRIPAGLYGRDRRDPEAGRVDYRRGWRDRPRPDRPHRHGRLAAGDHARRQPARAVARQDGAARVHRIDHRQVAARARAVGIRGRNRLSPRGAALDPLGVHADDGAPGECGRDAQPARVLAARGRVARTARDVHVSLVDRRLRVAGSRNQAARRAR